MKLNSRVFVSTVASDCGDLAEKYGLGIELAQFCTAYNMDTYFDETDREVRDIMQRSKCFVFHAPFNELTPAAIDPLVLDITRKRYLQAVNIAANYGVKKLVIHSGYTPRIYYKSWFIDRSIEFWSEFLKNMPADINICLENVMEDEPDMLVSIIEGVSDSRFGLCLDIGHARVCQTEKLDIQWAERMIKHLHHMHIHNNHGVNDEHLPLSEGIIPVKEILDFVLSNRDDTTFTIENPTAERSVMWLLENGYIE